MREQIKSIATRRVVRHIEEHGPVESDKALLNLAWECIEGTCERDRSGTGRRYLAAANDRGLDRLNSEVANGARRSLSNVGLRAAL